MKELREIPVEVFDSLFPKRHSVYDSSGFNLLNGAKVERLKAFALFDENEKPVVGQIFGLRDGLWRAPFSAPFSVASVNGENGSLVDEFYGRLSDSLEAPLRLVWSPEVYGMAIPNLPAKERVTDANFHYPMEHFTEGHFEQYLSRSGRYNHHRAMKHDFEFGETHDIERAYSLIRKNREAMGYPLAMSLAQVCETVKLVPAHFFIMTLAGEDIASAMIYDAAPRIAQVIYWGDLPQGRPFRAMNHLAYKVFEWYDCNRKDITIIDIGPASSDGVRNEGLCQFKMSIGCVETEKATMTINKN